MVTVLGARSFNKSYITGYALTGGHGWESAYKELYNYFDSYFIYKSSTLTKNKVNATDIGKDAATLTIKGA